MSMNAKMARLPSSILIYSDFIVGKVERKISDSRRDGWAKKKNRSVARVARIEVARYAISIVSIHREGDTSERAKIRRDDLSAILLESKPRLAARQSFIASSLKLRARSRRYFASKAALSRFARNTGKSFEWPVDRNEHAIFDLVAFSL